MEYVIFSYSDKFPVKIARFANVVFSNGSLPAEFLERFSKLQPLSVPSDVRRFFVSPEEFGQICLLSCILGENREIFFPNLEKAQNKYPVHYAVSDTSGEKPFEEFVRDTETADYDRFKSLGVITGKLIFIICP